SFALGGEVTNLAKPAETAYDLVVKADLDLAIVQEAGFAPEGVSASGRAGVDARAKGAVAAPERAELSGTVELAHGGVTTPTLPVPVRDLAGTIRLAGGNATLEKLSGSIGRSSFVASGVVENAASPAPRIRVEGRSSLLDLAELSAPPAPGAPAGAPASAGEGAPLIPPLPPVDASIHLLVDSLLTVGGALSDVELTMKLAGGKARVETAVAHALFGTIAMTSLRADLDVEGQTARGTFGSPRVEAQRVALTRVRGEIDLGEDKVLHVRNVAAGLFTGTVEGDATVDLSVPGDPAFSIRTTANGVEANDLVSALTPAKDLLHGTLNLRSSFAGRGMDPKAIAAGLTGSGDFEATAGRIDKTPAVAQVWNALQFGGRSSIPYKDLAAKFAVRDGRLVTDNVVVDSGDAIWKVSGAAAFDGTLDYDVEVELGEQLSEHYRKQLGGQLGSLLANTEGKLVLNLEIQGPAAKPRVTVDEQKLLERAKQNAASALQRKLKKEGDNLLGGLKDLIGK
ncbi:MAG: AsmA-like C-terminal region-containing protein, partial [bacterium]